MDISTLANVMTSCVHAAKHRRSGPPVVIEDAARIADHVRPRDIAGIESAERLVVAAIIELPDGASAEKIREILGPEGEDLMVHVTATWETIGVLLFHGELSIDIIDDFFSGPILISWRKLLPYTIEIRKQHQRDTWSEWFQWLAERMMERESTAPAVPAYIAHARGKKSYDRWLRRR